MWIAPDAVCMSGLERVRVARPCQDRQLRVCLRVVSALWHSVAEDPWRRGRECVCDGPLCSRIAVYVFVQDCSFPAYFYTQPMATGPGFYDNLCPQSWQDGSAATFTLQDPHQQTFDCPGN